MSNTRLVWTYLMATPRANQAEIARETGLDARETRAALRHMELSGRVCRDGVGYGIGDECEIPQGMTIGELRALLVPQEVIG